MTTVIAWTGLLVIGIAPASPAGGIRVNGAAVETKADPPCWPGSSDANRFDRYIACGNGTVLDTVTGLLWLEDADCLAGLSRALPGERNWWEAQAFAAGLAHGQCGLSDHSQPGDWRLPSYDEWLTMTDRAVALGCEDPVLTNDPGDDCLGAGPSSFLGVQSSVYWSAESAPAGCIVFLNLAFCVDPTFAVQMELMYGNLFFAVKGASRFVWPVRGGP